MTKETEMAEAEVIGRAIYDKLLELGMTNDSISPEYYETIATIVMRKMEELNIIETADNPQLKAKIVENYKKALLN